MVPQCGGGRDPQPRWEGRRLAGGYALVSVRRFGLVVGRAPRGDRDLDLATPGWQLDRRPAVVLDRTRWLLLAAGWLERIRSLAPSFAEGRAPARPRGFGR